MATLVVPFCSLSVCFESIFRPVAFSLIRMNSPPLLVA